VTLAYAYERLAFPVLSTVEDPPMSFQDRLLNISRSLVRIVPEEDLPDTQRKAFLELMERLTRVDDNNSGEGRLAATILQMSDAEAKEILSTLLSLALQITRLYAVETATLHGP
jgi:hypothetical protein